MSTTNYNWAQKFLSFKPIHWLLRGIAGVLQHIRNWFQKSIWGFFKQTWQQKPARILFLLALALPMAIVLGLTVILPITEDPFGQLPNSEATVPATSDTGGSVEPELLEKFNLLKMEEAYWQARLNLAKSRTIQLVIDLRDSLVALEINGVTVHQAKIHQCEVSRVLRQMRTTGRLIPWLQNGFTLQQELATLPKAPIRVKEAPKDTIEAMAAASDEIVLENRDVHFTWHFDRHLTVLVEQVQPPSFKGRLSKLWYTLQRNWGMVSETIRALSHFEKPRHRFIIEIELPGDDAKAIYRALPEKAGLALRL